MPSRAIYRRVLNTAEKERRQKAGARKQSRRNGQFVQARKAKGWAV